MPADLLLINVETNSAYFDTVNIDGEAVLSERFAAMGRNVCTKELQTYRGHILCQEPNPVI